MTILSPSSSSRSQQRKASNKHPGKQQNNKRQQTLVAIVLGTVFLLAIILSPWLLGDSGLSTALAQRNRVHASSFDWLLVAGSDAGCAFTAVGQSI